MRDRQAAAVLIPLYRDAAGMLRMVLIERTDFGLYGGQIAFPGGKYEPTDRTMRDTAIRETCEELGLARRDLEVLDDLPAMATRSTRFLVWPFVARLRGARPRWRPREEEVASVLDVRVTELADPAAAGEQQMDFPDHNFHERVPVIRVEGHTIWGLTLRILQPVLPRILAGEYPV